MLSLVIVLGLFLVFAVTLYVYVSYRGYALHKAMGNENAWISFIPHFQVFAHVELLSKVKKRLSHSALVGIFIILPAVVAVLGAVFQKDGVPYWTYQSGNILVDILSVMTSVLFVYLTVVLVKHYTPNSSTISYGIFSVLFGPFALAVWAHRHGDEIVRVFKLDNGDTVIDGIIVSEQEITVDVKEELFDGLGADESNKDIGGALKDDKNKAD